MVWGVVAAFGLATKLYGDYQTGKAKSAALHAQAEIDFLKADETLRRNRVNRDLLFTDTEKILGEQAVALAGSGFSIDAGYFARMEETTRIASEQAIRQAEEAHWDASMSIATGKARIEGAEDIEGAAPISALGGAVLGGYNIYAKSPGGL